MRLSTALLALSMIAGPAAAGQLYYAYAEVPTLDGKGHPVADRNGKQAIEGVCLVWQAGWDDSLGYVRLEVESVFRWYTGLGYHIDTKARTATFTGRPHIGHV